MDPDALDHDRELSEDEVLRAACRTVHPTLASWQNACSPRLSRASPPYLGLARGSDALDLGQRRDGHRRNAGTVTATSPLPRTSEGSNPSGTRPRAGTATSPADFLSRTGRLKFTGGHRDEQGRDDRRRRHARQVERDLLHQFERPGRRDDRGRRGERDHRRQRRAAVGVVVATLAVPEGNSGDTPFASVEVTLSAASG